MVKYISILFAIVLLYLGMLTLGLIQHYYEESDEQSVDDSDVHRRHEQPNIICVDSNLHKL